MPTVHTMHPPLETLSQSPERSPEDMPAFECSVISHRISAGFPYPAGDYVEDGLDLNAYLVWNKPSMFMFSVKGDSIVGASIESGDKVVAGYHRHRCCGDAVKQRDRPAAAKELGCDWRMSFGRAIPKVTKKLPRSQICHEVSLNSKS